jgi:hypothetical protein
MLLTKTFLAAAAITGGLLASPPLPPRRDGFPNRLHGRPRGLSCVSRCSNTERCQRKQLRARSRTAADVRTIRCGAPNWSRCCP